jgi:DeoR/GlpR family transcriptional regulator of sugar metabolism
MVSFAKEQVISPQRLAKRLGVSVDTVRRMMRSGLESTKLLGKRYTSLEALDRFAEQSASRVIRERPSEVTEAMEALRRMGVNVGKDSVRDGNEARSTAAA